MTGPAAAASGPRQPAAFWRRVAALTYDLLLLTGVLAVYATVAIIVRGGRAIEPNTAWFTASLLAISGAFFGWCWTHGGQTLGMLAWRLRVVTADGGPLTWRHALIRFPAGCVSLVAAGLGFFWSCADPQHRTWHDRLSGTLLVYEPKRPDARLVQSSDSAPAPPKSRTRA